MEKRIKALKGLACCTEYLCGECPYTEHQHVEYKLRCITIMHRELNEILQPKQVILVPDPNENYPDEVNCPTCKKHLGFVTHTRKKYCPECGQALKYS